MTVYVTFNADTSHFDAAMVRTMRRIAVSVYLRAQREGRRDLAYPIGIRLRGES